MGYNELEIELRKTLAQIVRWREAGYMPTIEQGIALGRLRKIYAGLLELPCSEPEAQLEGTGTITDSGAKEVVSDSMSGGDGSKATENGDESAAAPEDESFELGCEPDVPDADTVSAAEVGEDGDFAVAKEKGGNEMPLRGASEVAGLDLSPGNRNEAVREEDKNAEDVRVKENGENPEPAAMSGKLPRIFGREVSPYARHEIIDTLFHGNAELFETETAKLNGMGSLEDALVYIGETYRWIPENAATIKFIDLLEARFQE